MMTVARFALRELSRARFRLLLVALILAIQVAALGGGVVAQESLLATREGYERTLRLADLDVRIAPASDEELPTESRFRAIPGIAGMSRRFLAPGFIERPDGSALAVVVHYLEPGVRPAVDDVELLSGDWLRRGAPEHMLVDRSFADAHALAIGDELVVNPRRFATRFVVGGTVLSPEYLVPTANPELLVPRKGSLGVVFASREALDRMFVDRLYNDLVFTFEPDADRTRATRSILALLHAHTVEHVATKQTSFGHRYVDVMLGGSRVVTPAIALAFAIVAMIVIYLSIERLVIERRREIGCFLAQGFSAKKIALAFLALGCAAGLAGALAGIPAALGFGLLVARISASASGFPTPRLACSFSDLAMAGATSPVIACVSALFPALGVLRRRPIDAIRGAGEVRFAGLPKVLAAFLVMLTKRAGALYAIRNLFRRRRLSIITVVLVMLSVALPAALLTTLASWDTWSKDQAERMRWDALATFKVPLAETHVKELLEGRFTYEPYVQGRAIVRGEEMRVRGLPVPTNLVAMDLADGHAFSADDADEAIVNTGFRNGAPPPAIGERVVLSARGRTRTVVIVGHVNDAAPGTILVPHGMAQQLFDLRGKASGVYVRRVDASLELAAMKKMLFEDELVTSVLVREELASETARYLDALHAVVLPFVGLAALLAFAFLSGVLAILLAEREAEYATLRALGYGSGQIARTIFLEVGTLALLGTIGGALSWAAAAFVLRIPMAHAWFHVPLDFRARDFGFVIAPTLVALAIASVRAIKRVMRADLKHVLNARGMG